MTKMSADLTWFKTTFAANIETALDGTPFGMDLVCAIAMQETYYIWGDLYKRLAVEDLLAVCVGDTLDAPNRSAFPKTKADLLKAPDGDKMFKVARDALESIGQYVAAYHRMAELNPNKFCHGFGIFQYDIQFFRDNPDFFLDSRWSDFDECLAVCLNELINAKKRAFGDGKTSLTHDEMVFVAIAYNAGKVNTKGTFKQGFKDDTGRYYGENIATYLQLAEGIRV